MMLMNRNSSVLKRTQAAEQAGFQRTIDRNHRLHQTKPVLLGSTMTGNSTTGSNIFTETRVANTYYHYNPRNTIVLVFLLQLSLNTVISTGN